MPRERRAGGGIDRLPSGRYRVRIVTPDGRRLSLGTHPTKRAAEAAYARSVTDQADGKPATPSAVTTPTFADYASGWVDTRLTKRGEPLRPRVKDLYLMQLRLHILPTFGDDPAGADHHRPGARLERPPAQHRRTRRQHSGQVLPTAPLDPHDSRRGRADRDEPLHHQGRRSRTRRRASHPDGRPGPRPRRATPGEAPLRRAPRSVRRPPARARSSGCGAVTSTSTGARSPSSASASSTATASISSARPSPTPAGESWRSRRCSSGTYEHHLDAYAQPGDDGYVFTGQKGGPLAPHVWQGAWEKARTEVGVPEIHLHDLRHLAGTLAASTGASTKEVMYRLGHATHQAALRYQHATRQRDRAIADALDHLIDPRST